MTSDPSRISGHLGRVIESKIREVVLLLKEAEDWLVHWDGYLKGSSSKEHLAARGRLGAVLSRCKLTAGSVERLLAELVEIRVEN